MNKCGRIELIMGPMFAGKTTELMRRVKREIHARRSCFVIKYAKDVRYDKDSVASHDQLTLKAQAAVTLLADVADRWRAFDVVAVDEGQFFPDLVPFCNTVADAGKIVMVSALDGDYLRKPFGHICELVPYCESVKKLTAVCMMCHCREASFTRRTVHSNEQELIGGADMYIATCRACYNETSSPSLMAMRSVQQAIRDVERACLGMPGKPVAPPREERPAATVTPARCHRAGSEGSGTSSGDEALVAPKSPESPGACGSAARATVEGVCGGRKHAREASAEVPQQAHRVEN